MLFFARSESKSIAALEFSRICPSAPLLRHCCKLENSGPVQVLNGCTLHRCRSSHEVDFQDCSVFSGSARESFLKSIGKAFFYAAVSLAFVGRCSKSATWLLTVFKLGKSDPRQLIGRSSAWVRSSSSISSHSGFSLDSKLQ